jgi:hypothetical protein
MALKQLERDELLIRLDERTLEMKDKVDYMEKHLRDLNGQVIKNTSFRKTSLWVGGALFTGIVALAVAVCTQGFTF